MLFGRAREVRELFQNLHQGIHAVAFGISGAGKTAVLLEVESKLRVDQKKVIHIDNCSSRRSLLEGALSNLHKGKGQSNSIPIKELRDELLTACRKQPLCLVLDHAPVKLHHRMQRLFEILENCCTLAFGVTAGPDSYDLYYWKFNALEIGNLRRKSALDWIDTVLGRMGYENPLKKTIAGEIFHLTGGNPGSIARTIAAISSQPRPIDDPIRIRRIFVDGRISMNSNG